MEVRFDPKDFDQYKDEVDWFGLWYKIMRDRGDNDEPTFGRLDLSTARNEKKVEWFRFSHSYMDGVGVLNYLYQKRGITLSKFPDLKEKCPPSFMEYVIAFIKLIFQKKGPKVDWIEKNFNYKHTNVHRLSFDLLTADETAKLELLAKKEKVSLCALLMDLSSRVLLNELSSNQCGTWTLPVNLRPVLKRKNYNSNHSSGILIPFDSRNDTPFTINQNIKDSLKNKVHWCVWQVHQIGKIIGLNGMRYISKNSSKKTFMIGSFSYFGNWELPANEIWVGGPPGSKNFPISIMVMIANKQLCFSLKIHPFILKNQDKTEEILAKIFMEMRNYLEKN